jgi:MarR family transcriptional regulator, organic hydroperoxide resistance regulator
VAAPETAEDSTERPTQVAAFQSPAAEAWDAFQELFMQQRPRMLEIQHEFGLKPPPLAMTLKLIDEPTPMGRIADLLCCDGSTVTWIVDRLEERGLVERRGDPGDRRVRLVALTQEGRRIRDEIRARFAQPPAAIAQLPAGDQRALRDILRRALGHTPV